MRESLVGLLEALGHAVRSFSSAREFRGALTTDAAGVLIVDMYMPEETGLELCQSLFRDGIRMPIIFMTAHADVTTAVAAMKSGAIEFLEKPFDRQTLVAHVEKAVALGREWRDREQQFAALDDRIARLSRVDRETLELILAGETNKRMAAMLDLTERAVELRRQRLMQRLETRSLAELMEFAVTHRVLREIRQIPDSPHQRRGTGDS
ncbi:MAG: response regulator transcription factor, partial [Planctomycetaceae bacterium]|nr:response regulator transcription factor [Planctomycetaceae bacterium]